ncbi:hypothetical protein EPUL_004633, partial [Erysiphe pulchra]
QNLRRQQSAVPAPLPEEVQSLNCDTITGNNITNNIDPQLLDLEMDTNSRVIEDTNLENVNSVYCNGCKRNLSSNLFSGIIKGKVYKLCSDCRLRRYNRRRPQALHAQNISETHIQIDKNNDLRRCTMCRKNCPSNSFTSSNENSPFTTCNDCRLSKHNRRYPPLFPTRSTDPNIMYPLGREEDIYDVSDNENGNAGAHVRQSGSQEVVGEEAMADDEPVIILSHTDSREYAAHMRAREALPENHDDIFDNLDTENLDQENVNPFEDVDDVVPAENGGNNSRLNEDNMQIDNDNGGNETNSETTAPRRLPQWLAPLPTHRTIPAAYTSRYNRNLPTHNLGRCTSVCPFCHALHWPQERVHSSSIARPRFQTCCKEGQVVLNEMPEPPAYLRWLWTSDDRDAKAFRNNSRQYNRAFAFTSFKYTEDRRLADRGIHGGLRSFSIHGQIYHQ